MGDRGLAHESDLKRHLNVEGLARGQPWGKLVKVDSCETGVLYREVLLVKRECTVGRSKRCDLSFPAKRRISQDHCKIIQDERSGKVWLEDMSTNGTVINKSTLVKNQTHMLHNGDVIYFVYRKDKPEQNIAYVYHSIQPERTDSHDISSAGPNAADLMEERSSHRQTVASPDLSFYAGPAIQPQLCSSSTHLHTSCPAAAGPIVHTNSFAPGQARKRVPTKEKCAHVQEPESKKRRKTKPDEGCCDLSLPNLSGTEAAGLPKGGPQDRPGKAPPVEGAKMDKMEEYLTCIICQDLLYDCVSLQPCMHTFCAACYSGWMDRSALCPACRCTVERINKNHILNNLVEAYLSQHPEKCRSEADKRSMDGRNKITRDMLQPKVVERSVFDEEGSSDDLFELSDDDEGEPFMIYSRTPDYWEQDSFYWLYSTDEEDGSDSLSELSDSDSDAPDTSQPCRQCPGYSKDGSRLLFQRSDLAGSPVSPSLPSRPTAMPMPGAQGPGESPGEPSAGEEPSSSSKVPAMTAPPEYRCPAQGGHVVCACCLQPMPDRRGELGGQQEVPAQQCMLCQRPFCHMYWGCQRTACRGCLAHFSELNLTNKCLDGVLNGNKYESEILENYLSTRGMSWKDMLQEALQGLQQGTFYLSDYRINAEVIVCFSCGMQCFKDLAYEYRRNIPASDLPASVTSRPDCYWGRNCRTQVKKNHAMKFNHICEQTRFKR